MFSRSVLLFVALGLHCTAAPAQQATEMYLPIGASPGVSRTASVIGTIASVEADGKTFTISDGSHSVTVAVPESAPVWLDRSRGKGPNRTGSTADLKPGRSVEVKYREASRATAVTAEWVKVAVTD